MFHLVAALVDFLWCLCLGLGVLFFFFKPRTVRLLASES